MTSEIKPEDVKLPEPMRIMVGVEGFQFQALDVTVFTADQVRAAVLEATMAERERCAQLCWDRSDDGDGSEWDSSAIACAERIRSGHSVTETKRD